MLKHEYALLVSISHSHIFMANRFSDSDVNTRMQELYGRIRLCNAMVQDHFMPAYLSALDSARSNLGFTRSVLAS